MIGAATGVSVIGDLAGKGCGSLFYEGITTGINTNGNNILIYKNTRKGNFAPSSGNQDTW